MAMRKKATLAIDENQENRRTVKSVTCVISAQVTKRGVLGEIANKPNIPISVKPLEKPRAVLAPIVKPYVAIRKVADNPAPLKVVAPRKERVAKVSLEPIKNDAKTKEREAFSADLLPIEDIDEIDRDNPVLVSVYSNDIYSYLRELEKRYPVTKGFLSGQEVTPKMRSILIDWLVEVHQQFRLLQETLYLTVAIIDRFLQVHKSIVRKRLQLVGITAMLIACKYEEMYSPCMADFVYITDNTYTKAEILQMEMVIARTLDYSLGRPLPLHFLRRYSKAGRALPVHHTMAKYFMEQSLLHYELAHYSPSLVAAAAMYLSFFVIGHEETTEGQVIWTKTLSHYSTYTKDDVFPVVREIAAVIVNAEGSKYQAITRKYTHAKHMKISQRPELKSPTFLALAKTSKKE